MKIDDDRRAWVRYPTRAAGPMQFVEAQGELGWWARIEDASLGGMAILLPRRVAPGTVLVMDHPTAARRQARTLPMRIVHATPHANGGWMMGCQFTEALSQQEFEMLLTPGQLREPSRPTRVVSGATPAVARD